MRGIDLSVGSACAFVGALSRGLPMVVIVLVVTVFIFHFVLNNTVLGRYIYQETLDFHIWGVAPKAAL